MPARSKGAKGKVAQGVALDKTPSTQGRKPMFHDQKLREEIMMRAPFLTPRDISRRLGLAERIISDWLNAGDRAIAEGKVDNEYALFRNEYRRFQIEGRFEMMMEIKKIAIAKQDWKGIDRLLSRTDDEMQYIDRDRIAGRTETNITIGAGGAVQSGAPSLADLQGYLQGRQARVLEDGYANTVEGEIVDE